MTTRIEIDPNVRVRGNGTYAGFEDVDGPLVLGQAVEVYESEANIVGLGKVAEIDTVKQLVYLFVEWSSLRDPGDYPSQEPPSRHDVLVMERSRASDAVFLSARGFRGSTSRMYAAANAGITRLHVKQPNRLQVVSS